MRSKGRTLGARLHESLVAMTGAYGNSFAAGGTAAAENGGAGLGLHARPEPVCLHAVAAVGLKCALRHRAALPFPLGKILCLACLFEYTGAENWFPVIGVRNSGNPKPCHRASKMIEAPHFLFSALQ
jgi:hypothetical protein